MDERAFYAAQEFLLAAKTYWSTTMYRALRDTWEANAGDEGDCWPQSLEKTAEILEDTTLYRYFAWLERHLQRLKYTGRYGLVPFHNERRGSLQQNLNAVATRNVSLDLDENLELPHYYTGIDIHQHPGGIWSDAIAGFIYESGARTTVPLLGKMHKDLHARFAELIALRSKPRRILDMGCGFGLSTQPLLTLFPEARVDAIDFSESCLTLAANTVPEDQARLVRYRQMDACSTDYAESSFDLVTSTMLLHELPVRALDRLLEETIRLLKPGGRMIHLDFYFIPDAFRRFLHYGHARRNNEPYMQPLAELNLRRLLADKGFVDIQILPFREADTVDLEKNDAWRFPWTVIDAIKPAE